MPQIKEPVSNKFNKIELKIQEIIFSSKSWIFYLNFCQNSRNLIFILNFHRFFLYKSFYLVHFHSSCKISGQTDKMPRNESKNKSVWKIFLCIFRCIFRWNFLYMIYVKYIIYDTSKSVKWSHRSFEINGEKLSQMPKTCF